MKRLARGRRAIEGVWARRSKRHTMMRTSVAKKQRFERRELKCYGFGLFRKTGWYSAHAARQRWRGTSDAVN